MITHITITNLGAFASLDLSLPAVALARGKNGSGKTTLLDALRYLADSGHDPDIIHGNAEWGEVVVTLDNGSQIRARASRATGETTRAWKPADGKRWVVNRKLIDSICRSISYDPVRFLEKTPKEQAEELLRLAPIDVTPEEISAAVGDAEAEARAANFDAGMSGLEIINAIHRSLYDSRRALNTGADTQAKHAAELERTLPAPAADAENWTAKKVMLSKEKSRAEAEERQALNEIRSEFEAAKDAAELLHFEECRRINAEIEEKISQLRALQMEQKQITAATRDKVIEEAFMTGDLKSADTRSNYRPLLNRLQSDLAVAEERARIEEQATGTRQAIEKARASAEAQAARAAVLTGALDRLNALKLTLAGRLPIPGVQVDNGRIVREEDGGLVPLARWNTADQITLCLRIGMLIGGGLICVDHIEAFDGPHRERLLAAAEKYAREKGVQFILAAVDPDAGEFTVEDVAGVTP